VEAVRDSNLNVGGNVLESNGHVVDRARRRADQSVDDVEADRRRRSGRCADLRPSRSATCMSAMRFACASLVNGTQGSGRRGRGRRERREHEAGDRRGQGRDRADPAGPPAGVRIVPFYDRSTLIEQSSTRCGAR
jgi:Cu/Ag efflux pump CusA